MARITPAPPEQYEPLFGEDAPMVMQIYSHRPELAKGFGEFVPKVLFENTLSPRLVELVRLRIAFHNQCRSCMALRYEPGKEAGVDEDLVCSLEKPEEADDLTEAERAALAYADLMANNHLAINDATYDGLREHFDEGQIVELGLVCAMCIGTGRLAATWDMVDDLPDYYHRRDETLAPWEADAVVAR